MVEAGYCGFLWGRDDGSGLGSGLVRTSAR